MDGTEETIRRYYEVVADLESTEADLRELLDPAVEVVEHPNLISPSGSVRDRDAIVAGFLAGKKLLSSQKIDVHEVLVDGARGAVRATWRGTIGQGSESLSAGTELTAEIAALLTVSDGRILDHETFDCYRRPA